MKRVIECVPNFSEGVNEEVINHIAVAISSVPDVKLLNVDPGRGANRTVMTFAGEPEAVVKAAYQAIKTAAELIDMRTQKGTHPRMGATDVCPLIPISNITLDEVAVYAQQLARRVGEELHIPVYLYEHAQADKSRSNLSVIRGGEYEGFFEKIKLPGWAPDFGPHTMNAQAGATVIGARDFLVAYNVNLDTTSTDLAHQIAQDVRETGRTITTPEGKLKTPGTLKQVKAIGWFIEEYGKAQVSMNLTNINVTPIHLAFDEVCARAAAHGVNVTGSELIGMIPLKAMLDAGLYFSIKQGVSQALSNDELIDLAVNTMGLNELKPFYPGQRIIEFLI